MPITMTLLDEEEVANTEHWQVIDDEELLKTALELASKILICFNINFNEGQYEFQLSRKEAVSLDTTYALFDRRNFLLYVGDYMRERARRYELVLEVQDDAVTDSIKDTFSANKLLPERIGLAEAKRMQHRVNAVMREYVPLFRDDMLTYSLTHSPLSKSEPFASVTGDESSEKVDSNQETHDKD